MKLLSCIVCIISITSCTNASQDAQNSNSQADTVLKPRIEIVQPTIKQEASSIWRTINDITFFEKQGYTIHLPKDPLVDSLIAKSKNGTFGNNDFPAIYTLLDSKVFDSTNYEQAIHKVDHQLGSINKMLNEIDAKKAEWDWNFTSFDKYKVVFTLYGTGGSYDPNEGVITLWTNATGDFKNYDNPANTIIHEITHIGMEYSLVRKYKLSHGLKERLVDTFVHLMFQKQLPEYRIQNMGDINIDEHLRTKEHIRGLNAIIVEFIGE